MSEDCDCYARHQKGGHCPCLCHPVNRLDAAGLLMKQQDQPSRAASGEQK